MDSKGVHERYHSVVISRSLMVSVTVLLVFAAFAIMVIQCEDSSAKAGDTFSDGTLTYEIVSEEQKTVKIIAGDYAGKITIPSAVGGYSVVDIEDGAFSQCSNLTYFNDLDNDYFTAVDGILYKKPGITMLWIPLGYSGTASIPSDLRWIDTSIIDTHFDFKDVFGNNLVFTKMNESDISYVAEPICGSTLYISNGECVRDEVLCATFYVGTYSAFCQWYNYGDTVETPFDTYSYVSGNKLYTVTGWQGFTEGTKIYADLSFTAILEESDADRTVTFYDRFGKVYSKYTSSYGAAVVLPADPEIQDTELFTYDFVGWEGYTEGMTVTEDLEFDPVYDITVVGEYSDFGDITHYYYDQLNDREKAVYNGIKGTGQTGTMCTVTFQMTNTEIQQYYYNWEGYITSLVNKALNSFVLENVQCCSITGMRCTVTVDRGSTVSDITLQLSISRDGSLPEDYWEQVTAVLKNIHIDTSTSYSTVQSIYEAVEERLQFDLNCNTGSVYTALAGTHIVTSAGYANVFKLLCDMYGINCAVVYCIDPSDNNLMVCNYVKMDDDKWYIVDSSRTDSGRSGIVLVSGTNTVVTDSKMVSQSYASIMSYYNLEEPSMNNVAYLDRTCKVTFQLAEDSESVLYPSYQDVRCGIPYNIHGLDSPGYTLRAYIGDEEITDLVCFDSDTTVTLKYTPRSYVIKFNSNGGSAVNDIVQSYGGQITLPTPTKDNYTFSYWALNGVEYTAESMPAKDLTLDAVWSATEHTVIYKVDGVKYGAVEKYPVGATVTVRDKFVREGYSVTDWSVTGSFVMSDEDVIITATTELITYTVTYLLNGEQYGEIETYLPGATVTLRAKCSEEGYDVTDWACDGFELSATFTMPENDLTITSTKTRIVCTVTYQINGETFGNVESYYYGDTVTLREKYSEAGHTVTDWSSQDIQLSATFVINVRTVLITATSTINNHSVTYYFDGVQYGDVEHYDYGVEVTIRLKIVKTGYTVSDWESADIRNNGTFAMPDKDVVFTSTSKINTHTVTYKVDGSRVGDIETYDYNELVQIRDPYVKEGYTVSAWDRTQDFYMPDRDVIISATSTINSYVLTYILKDLTAGKEIISSETVVYDTEVTLKIIPTTEGTVVTPWVSDDVVIDDGKIVMPAKDVTVTASRMTETHTVTYLVNGVQNGKVEKYNYNTTVYIRDKYTEYGHETTNWTSEQVYVTMERFTVGHSDIVFNATSVIGTYSVNYYVDGNLEFSDSYKFESKVTVRDTFVKTGYTVSGWMTSDVSISSGQFSMPGNNVSMNATSEINTYGVVYRLDGVRTGDIEYYDYNDTVTVRDKAVKEGYTVTDWSVTGTFQMPDHDVVITATSSVNSYTLTFDTDGGSQIEPKAIQYGASIVKPEDPARDGYEFKCWTYNGSTELPETMPASDITFKASWIKSTMPTSVNDSGSKKTVTYDTNEVGMTSDTVEKILKDTETVQVRMESVALDMGSSSFEKLSGKDSFTISAKVTTGIENESLMKKLSDDKKSVAEKAVVVNIDVATNGQRTDLGTVRVAVPYTLAEGQDPNNLMVYYVANNGDLEELKGEYSDGYLVFETTHFSTFAVCNGSLTLTEATPVDMMPIVLILIAVAIIAIAGVALVYIKKH